MKTKKTKIKKDASNVVLYARVSPDNLAYVEKRMKQEGMTKSAFTDKVLDDAKARGL